MHLVGFIIRKKSVRNYHYSLRNNPEERSSQCFDNLRADAPPAPLPNRIFNVDEIRITNGPIKLSWVTARLCPLIAGNWSPLCCFGASGMYVATAIIFRYVRCYSHHIQVCTLLQPLYSGMYVATAIIFRYVRCYSHYILQSTNVS